jgi:hypothetical protein
MSRGPLSLGSGFKTKDALETAEKHASQTQKLSQETWLKLLSDGKYSDKPSVPNQMSMFPGSVKYGPGKTKTFRWSEEAPDDEAYNEFMAQAHPEGAPRIVILHEHRHFSDHKAAVVVQVMYREVAYLEISKLVKKAS